ncbi:MAG: peptidoglycan DD-metalloendopeptidase family protein [Oscillochloridaceae bacterium umkhey_bin13]
MLSLRSTLRREPPRTTTHLRRLLVCWLLATFAALVPVVPARTASAAPSLILPTPPGEAWRIIQGYGCGTHNAWDRYSLDLIQVDGPTYNAPIRAAAGGEIWHWQAGSGTLILHHGGQFFTMYTHLARAVSTQRGRYIDAGETLGFAGDRGSPGVPHLHFTAFTANRDGWSGKQSIPLRFADGYTFPELGGCNQHGGTVVVSQSVRDPAIFFHAEGLQPHRWYNGDAKLGFTSDWSGGGLSQAWNSEPAPEAPMFPRATEGYARLADAGEGMHTLHLRVWGPDGRVSTATFGPIGFDATPPSTPEPFADLRTRPGPTVVTWLPSQDALAGTAGYRVYIGTDPDGTSEWFTPEPAVKTEPLAPGEYLVRVQALDHAGNASPWATVGTISVAPGP